MERTASIVLLIKTLIFLCLMLFVCAINIYIFVRHRRSVITLFVHISSLFGLCGLFCFMMDAIILNLPFESIFRTTASVSCVLCGTCLMSGLAAIAVKKRHTDLSWGLSPNLEAVFSATANLALVVDYRGTITQVNHPEKLDAICRRPTTLTDVLLQMKEKRRAAWPFPSDISALRNSKQCEVFLPEWDAYYLLIVSPIVSGDVRVGFTVLFEDISAVRQSENRLQEQNACLMEANLKLANYVKVAGALEAEKERLQILREIQETLIEKIEQAISCIRNIQNSRFANQAYQQEIKDTANLLRGVYKEVRASVSRIAGKDA